MPDILLLAEILESQKLKDRVLSTIRVISDQDSYVLGEVFLLPGPAYIGADGRLYKASAANAATADFAGVVRKPGRVNEPRTLYRKNAFDGFDLAALAFRAKIYLSDTPGMFADAPGTINVLCGTVEPTKREAIGQAPGKMFRVDR